MSYHKIREAIIALDENALSPENVKNLLKCVPQPEEVMTSRPRLMSGVAHNRLQIAILQEYTDDKSNLDKAEQYFLEVMTIPRLEQRLQCFQFKLNFDTQMEEIQPV